MVQENIRAQLVFETIFKGKEDLLRLNHNMGQVRKRMGRMSKEMHKATKPMIKNALQVEEMRGQYDSFSGVMRMSQDNFKKFNTQGGKFNSMGARMANRTRKMSHGLRGFRMEMLGVMFFGMAMVGLFGGLLKPAANLVGIFELWSLLLSIIFLPIMLLLLPIFLKFFKWVLSWGEDTKVLVGVLTIFGLLLGGFIMLFGMIALGVGSMILAFGFFLPLVLGAIAVFAGLGLIVSSVVMIIQGKMESIGLVIMGVGLILALFIGWWALIPIAVGAAIYLIVKHWDGLVLFFKSLWIDIKVLFIEGVAALARYFIDSKLLSWVLGKLGFDISFDEAIDGMVEALAVEKSMIQMQYELGKSLEETEESGKSMSDTLKDSIGGMMGESKKGNESISSSFEDGFDYSTFVVEDRTNLMAGMFDTGMLSMVDSSATHVEKINKNLSKIGASGTYEGAAATWLTPTGGEVGNSGWTKMNDFIWRAGQGAVAINPNDNLVGTKDGIGGGGNNISITNNIHISDKAEMERMIEDNNKSIVDELLRLIKTPTS